MVVLLEEAGRSGTIGGGVAFTVAASVAADLTALISAEQNFMADSRIFPVDLNENERKKIEK